MSMKLVEEVEKPGPADILSNHMCIKFQVIGTQKLIAVSVSFGTGKGV